MFLLKEQKKSPLATIVALESSTIKGYYKRKKKLASVLTLLGENRWEQAPFSQSKHKDTRSAPPPLETPVLTKTSALFQLGSYNNINVHSNTNVRKAHKVTKAPTMFFLF